MNVMPPLCCLGLLAIGLWLPMISLGADGASQVKKPGLDEYIRSFGFESVPLERSDGNHLVVTAVIEGKPRKLLLETGGTLTTMSRNLAKNWKSLGKMGVALQDPLLGIITNSDCVVMPSLELGAAMFTNLPVWVAGGRATLVERGEGLLGCEFFVRNHCLLDCWDQRLYVRANPLSAPARKVFEESLAVSGLRRVPLEVRKVPRVTCPMKLNDVPVTLLLDTGAFWTILDAPTRRKCNLQLQSARGMEIRGPNGAKGTVLGVRAKTIHLGDIAVKPKYPLGIADMSDWKMGQAEAALDNVDGVLGHELLFQYRALVDFGGKSLWILPQPAGKP